ncbi:hypothetical protein F1654_05450 [Alkalicaulis satelles]|uniref:Uncharacterized protein n=1 Tax=Alkalicaulis satelles TaxID=2609175 RepID=A0A5M6ZND5_9PROT|nr:hypothetical protein [Alkalicaulis satelles]KAA5805425.1 hypothetical protein F1654_05450 [Alkalicaulis satelles]
MNQPDDLLKRLSQEPPDRDLTGLEARVWSRIESMLENRRTAWLRALPVTATASALMLGFATALLSAPPVHEEQAMAIFSANSPLAPSTLLARSTL